MGALTVTETWLSLPWAVKTQLIDAIDEADGIGDLSDAQQAIIRRAQFDTVQKDWSEANQRRKPNGQFDGSTGAGGGGGTAGGAGALTALSAADQEGADAIKAHLEMISGAYGGPSPGLKTTPEKLLLEHGQAFATTPHTYDGKRGTPHHCYENSAKIAMQGTHARLSDGKDGLTYVEGYMTVSGVPLKHAWLVNKRGEVIDPTIVGHPDVKGYFGVPFKTSYVEHTAMTTKYWGIISMQTNRDMFRQGPPANMIAKVGSD